ncbi:ABC transporter, ATP-binding protein [Aphelenchoides besseyi]|nr:ABC transporter, ATP-binding protein [Aphelenchoides besseyi]
MAKLKSPAGDEEEAMVAPTGSDKKTQQGTPSRAKIDQVGILSYISFSWIFEYLWAAYRGTIAPDKTWPCSIFDAANVNTTRLQHLWNEELRRRPSAPSLFRVILRFISYRLIIACVIFVFCLIFGFIGPTCLVKGLISYTETPPLDEEGGLDYVSGLYLVIGILAVEISRVLMYGATWAVSYRTGIRVRGAVLSLLYKSLLSSKSLQSRNSAEIVNICANDGQRLFDAVTFAPLVLMGPFVIVGGVIYLLKVIGPWSLLGLLVFVIFDILQVFLGITLVRCRRLAIKNTEDRLHLMGEVLRNIRLIKVNCWEDLFMQKVIEVRNTEKHNLQKAGYAQSIAIASGTIVPIVATIVTVLAVVLSGNDILASDAFSAITVYFVMLFGIRMIPYGARYLGEAFAALRKIQQLLLLAKFEPNLAIESQSAFAIVLKGAYFKWDSADEPKNKVVNEEQEALEEKRYEFCLSDLNLSIARKEKIGICGAVGSGKTALLNSILGTTIHDKGTVSVAGTIAYASQKPCIMSGTIRENILFGQSMNSQRYDKAIHCARLSSDLQKMPANEMSEVGERGAALSGGQKARLSLARCFFSNREIYLFDDALNAINKKIADEIFDDGIGDLLSNKTVLLVTSNPEHLSKCDRVVFMSGGSIHAVGEHSKLMVEDPVYKNFFEDRQKDDSTKTNETPAIETANAKVENGDVKQSADLPTSMVVEEENLELKGISKDVYIEYLQAAGGYTIFSLILLLFFANVGSGIFSTIWLSKWMKDVHGTTKINVTGVRDSSSLAENEHLTYYAVIYVITIVVLFVTGLLKAMAFVKLSIRASTNLHNQMLHSILHGIAAFFDSTPTGRILNRFSKDLDEIDVKLPFSSEALLQYMITCMGFLLTIIWVFPAFFFACIPLGAIFIVFFLCFRAGIRSLKRTENVSRSPVFDHVTSSLDGLGTVHAFGQNERFVETFKTKLDENSSSMFMFNAAMRWQAVWLDLLVVAVSFMVSCLIVLLTQSIAPSDAGMALAFALQMSGVFQFAVRSQTELESKLTAVERVSYYYKNIEQEKDSNVEVKNWPSNGDIKFNDVSLRYRAGVPLAIDHVNFEIKDSEKVGVIGRTGSGKSTLLTNALFRLYPLESGSIQIAQADISTIGLKQLRKAMALIPQESGLFTGTLRFNLDPEHKHTDAELWSSLESAGLKNFVSSTDDKLELRIEDGGKNLSSGQQQLVCLARTLLRNVRIVILDEATAMIDHKTDSQIQTAIHETFAACTVLLISHRMQNVAGMSKTLEVEDGQVRIIGSSADQKPKRLYPEVHVEPIPETHEKTVNDEKKANS